MDQLFFLLLLILCGGAVLRFFGKRSAASAQKRHGWRTLTHDQAKERLDSGDPVILLDVRTQEEYETRHIPDAVCLPVEDLGPDMPVAFDPGAEILVYCRSGRRSAQAAERLSRLGYTNVSDFGGILDWPYETTAE